MLNTYIWTFSEKKSAVLLGCFSCWVSKIYRDKTTFNICIQDWHDKTETSIHGNRADDIPNILIKISDYLYNTGYTYVHNTRHYLLIFAKIYTVCRVNESFLISAATD